MAHIEIWRKVPKMNLLASNSGRIMVIPYAISMPHGGFRQYGGYPTRGQYVEKERRWIYVLKGKTYKVSRLVCSAFHGEPPFKRAVVMHVDEDPNNNTPSNLQWGTQKENLNAPGFINYCKSRTGANNPRIKGKVLAQTLLQI